MNPSTQPDTQPDKYVAIVQVARQLYEQEPDWVTFFREVLGVDGMVRRSLSKSERIAFQQSAEFNQIQEWLMELRGHAIETGVPLERTKVITVRLPKSMRDYLREEAHEMRTSMNKLCISKLLQAIGADRIPRKPDFRTKAPERQEAVA